MTIDTKPLRELAAKATPGPWKADKSLVGCSGRTDTYDGVVWGSIITAHDTTQCDGENRTWSANGGGKHENATYIAAVSPDVVTGLLDEIDCLREIERAARCIRHWHDSGPDGMVVSAEHVRALWAALDSKRVPELE